MSYDPPAWMGWKQPGPQDPRATPRTTRLVRWGGPTGAGLCLGTSLKGGLLTSPNWSSNQFQRWGLRPKMRPPKVDGCSGEDAASLPEQRGDRRRGR